MGFFGNIFKSKEKRIHAQKYKVGMKKTRESVFNNLDDDNMNGWPDPGEYSSMSLLKPSNLGALVGQYTLLLDDSGGSIGQKVAVYIVGQDTAGYAIKDAGSNQSGDHLFMYQLAPDGDPTIGANVCVGVAVGVAVGIVSMTSNVIIRCVPVIPLPLSPTIGLGINVAVLP